MRGITALYLYAVILAVLAASASSMGANNCFNVIKKRRRSVKTVEDKEVQQACQREADKVVHTLDENVKSVGRRRSPPTKKVETGWGLIVPASVP